MTDRNRLSALGNAELLEGLAALVRQSNELASEVLAHLMEVEARLLYAELGFPSMFAYCVGALGLCESSAWRRITAARVCREFPEVLAKVARGELHLSAVCSLAKHLTVGNAPELFQVCSGKKRREVDQWLAARFPRADVPDRLQKLEALSEGRFGLHFTADAEFVELLDRMRALASHRAPGADLASLIKLALRDSVQLMEKRRFGVGRKPRAPHATVATPSEPVANQPTESLPPGERENTGEIRQRSRYVRVAAARKVYTEGGGDCCFVAADGRRCGARAFLQLDHIHAHARGGSSEAVNLRSLCWAHNHLAARRNFGARHVKRAIARSRTKQRAKVSD